LARVAALEPVVTSGKGVPFGPGRPELLGAGVGVAEEPGSGAIAGSVVTGDEPGSAGSPSTP